MNRRAMLAIVRKDLLVVRRSRATMIPIVLVPTILLVLLPGLVAVGPRFLPGWDAAELLVLLEGVSADRLPVPANAPPDEQAIILLLGYLFAPLFLLIPMMIASVIAADSFAGERERRTLEALLYTPTTDRELVVAKMLGPWIAAVGIAWVSFVAYSVVANLAAWPTVGRVFFPTPVWWPLVFWLVPAVAGLGMAATVLVSARVKGFTEAYQLGSLVVLPLVALIVAQFAGAVLLGPGTVLILGAGVWLVVVPMVWIGAGRFRRGSILARS